MAKSENTNFVFDAWLSHDLHNSKMVDFIATFSVYEAYIIYSIQWKMT